MKHFRKKKERVFSEILSGLLMCKAEEPEIEVVGKTLTAVNVGLYMGMCQVLPGDLNVYYILFSVRIVSLSV